MQAEDRVEEGEQDQDDAGLPLLQAEAHQAGPQQDELHQVGVLADERAPPGLGLPGIERVGPEPFDPSGGLGRGQAVLPVHPLRLQHLIGPQRVPDRSVFAWR